MLGGNSKCVPPEPISNSEVKPFSADDSVRSSHVKVGHRQAPNKIAMDDKLVTSYSFYSP